MIKLWLFKKYIVIRKNTAKSLKDTKHPLKVVVCHLLSIKNIFQMVRHIPNKEGHVAGTDLNM